MTRWLQAAKEANRVDAVTDKPTQPAARPVLSVLSVLSEGGTPDPVLGTPYEADLWRHGASVTGSPRTWTGRLVTLAAWRDLTEWERHGPNGRHWNGATGRWEQPEGGAE